MYVIYVYMYTHIIYTFPCTVIGVSVDSMNQIAES